MTRVCQTRSISAAVLVCALVAPAWGAPRVSWSGDEGCPRPADLLSRIARLVGSEPRALEGKLQRFDARVRRSGRWRMRLVLRTHAGGGEREFSAETCDQLTEGAALIAAMAIDPRVAQAPRPSAARRKPTAVRLALRPLLRGELGVLPDPGLSFGLAVGLLLGPSLRLELELTHGLPVTAKAGQGDGGADLRLPIAGAVSGCWRRQLGGRLELDLCLGLSGGWLHGSSFGISEPRSGGSAWAAGLGGGALSFVITRRWAIRLGGQLGVSLSRPDYEIEGVGRVHQPALGVGRVGGGIEARLF